MDKFLIIDNQDEEVTYVAKVTKSTVKLRRSKSEIWSQSARGEEIGKLVDTGNNIEINTWVNGVVETLKFNHSEFVQLYHLVSLKYKTDKDL